jgi:hypothetical protein
MRTSDQIAEIEKTFEDPYTISNFISEDEIKHLLSIYKNASSKNSPLVYKNTGPVTLDLYPYMQDSVIDAMIKKIKTIIGDYEITASFFFETDYPHIIHNDDTFELPSGVFKAINIPLEFQGNYDSVPKLCFFDQCYFHGPAKFFHGDNEIPTYYNKQIYDYMDVKNLVDSPIGIELYQKYFTHLKPAWLNGLSLKTVIDQHIGSAIIFDSVRLHCSNDFRRQGIKSKIALSIFTKRI